MWLPSSPTWPPNDLSRQAAMAERIGFDSVWSIDSQLLCRDVMVSLTGILFATTTLRAATGVTQPVTRHASVTGWDDAGTAEPVRERLAGLLDQPGVDRVILSPQIVGPGAKPLDGVLRELELRVLPYL
jgi:alkanesulfonate monooxygenase SsuD/methylene tetrahydromethanopterin reductase-like flavin-dependent oxidoreductase (luciferase family)